jgi:hypothetical protein
MLLIYPAVILAYIWHTKDLVARFTLDSATEFLFGQDVETLSAPLPYPPNTPQAQSDSSADHPANRFASAFLEAQEASTRRGRYANMWPLWELWENKVDKYTHVMDEFIQPVLKAALAKKSKASEAQVEEAGDEETLLGHLVRLTDGEGDPKISAGFV